VRALLTVEQERLRADLRATLGELGSLLKAIGASPADQSLLADALRGLGELFLLVVIGEFNTGKSTLLNELIGSRLLPEGVTPTTAAITLIRYGERESEEWHDEGYVERRVPSAPLRDLAVVDTPGTNAIIRRHEALTRDFVPRADLVLFVTSADRPFTETERELIAAVREWGKKVVVVVNKTDLLETPAAVDQVVEFVRDGLQSTLGFSPVIHPVSVRLARAATNTTDPAAARALLAASRLDELRTYVFRTLDETERLRLKLATPIGIGENLLARYEEITDRRLADLGEDLRLVDNVERQIDVYADDLRRGFGPRLAAIENVIHELNDRGERFFEETVRLGRVFDLLNPERTRGAFEREVVSDMAERIDLVIDGTVDWFVEAESRLWRQVSGIVRQRQQMTAIVSDDPDFIVARRDVLRAVADRTHATLSGFNREREAREIGQSMRDTVAQTALAEIGAVSLGAAIAIMFGTALADVTGLLAATLTAGLGLYIIPMKKRRALAAFHRKTDELRERLIQSLKTQLDHEIAVSTERIREAIAPYTRYIRAEANRLNAERASEQRIRAELGRLRAQLPPVSDQSR